MEIGKDRFEEIHSNDDLIEQEEVAPNETQQGHLCSNGSSKLHNFTLCYNYIGLSDNLDRAFDLLFEEMMKTEQSHDDKND